MTEVRALTPQDRGRWDSFVQDSPHSHFGQSMAWMDVMLAEHDVTAEYWLAESDGRLAGILPLFRRPGRDAVLFSAPGGLLAEDEATAQALLAPIREQVARERLAWMELRDQRVRWAGLETNDEHVTMELELAGDADAQWARFDAKLRNQIRKGEKADFERRWGTDGIPVFHRVMVENLRDLGTPVRRAGYFRAAAAALGERAGVLVLEKSGAPVGAMFTVAHRDTLMDPWASCLRRWFPQCPNQVLYWEALRHAIATGRSRFDFGRSQWDSPTFRFKQQWGAQAVPLHYQYIMGGGRTMPTLRAQKGGMAWASRAWQRLPVSLATVLGEPLKRRFPEVL